jgi:hypothetical protein
MLRLQNAGKSREFHHVSGHFGVRVMRFDARGSTAESKNPKPFQGFYEWS